MTTTIAQIAHKQAEVRIRARLGEFYHPDEVDAWMVAPHVQLGGRSAADVIAEGRADLVNRVIDRLDASAYL